MIESFAHKLQIEGGQPSQTAAYLSNWRPTGYAMYITLDLWG